jgi:branched-chain amino acid transport system substrate-binding protein
MKSIIRPFAAHLGTEGTPMHNLKIGILASLLAGLMCQSALAVDKLKIGFLATLSGPPGLYGQNLRDGFMLGVEEANGNLGGVPTEVSINDAQFKPDVAKQLAEKLIQRDHVDIITGLMYSNVLLAIYDTVMDSKTVLISQSAGPDIIAGKKCSPYFFTTAGVLEQVSAAVGQYLEDKQVKSVVAIAANYQAGLDSVAGFKSRYKGTIVKTIYPALGQPDYSVELSEIAAAKPEAVYAFIPTGVSINFVKQYNEAGLAQKIPLYTTNMIGSATLPAIGDGAIGARSAAFWAIDLNNEASKHFVEAFRKKYNYVPSVYAAQAYDAARLIDAAVRKIGGKIKDKAALVKALATVKFDSVRGPFEFNTNHFPIQNFYATEIVKDKDGTLIEANRGIILKDDMDGFYNECPMK